MRARPTNDHGGTNRVAVGIDVGATTISAGVVDCHGRVLERRRTQPTPRSRSTGLADLLAGIVDDLTSARPEVAAVGVGIAGVVRWPDGAVRFAANHDHGQLPLRRLLQRSTPIPVFVDNDANTAVLAETVRPGRPARDVLLLAIGTGVGSGILLDGALWRGRDGLGAELGHTMIRRSGPRCACGRVGCVEVVASGTALALRARRILRDHPRSLLAQRVLRDPNVRVDVVIDAALDGDPHVLAAVRETGMWLGRGIGSAMQLFNVEDVVIGGGLSVLGELLLDPIRATCEREMSASRYLDCPSISLATHGNDATMIGAGLLALDGGSACQDVLCVTSCHDPSRAALIRAGRGEEVCAGATRPEPVGVSQAAGGSLRSPGPAPGTPREASRLPPRRPAVSGGGEVDACDDPAGRA